MSSFFSILSVAAFMQQWQSWVNGTETPAKPKISTICLFTENIGPPRGNISNFCRRSLGELCHNVPVRNSKVSNHLLNFFLWNGRRVRVLRSKDLWQVSEIRSTSAKWVWKDLFHRIVVRPKVPDKSRTLCIRYLIISFHVIHPYVVTPFSLLNPIWNLGGHCVLGNYACNVEAGTNSLERGLTHHCSGEILQQTVDVSYKGLAPVIGPMC